MSLGRLATRIRTALFMAISLVSWRRNYLPLSGNWKGLTWSPFRANRHFIHTRRHQHERFNQSPVMELSQDPEGLMQRTKTPSPKN